MKYGILTIAIGERHKRMGELTHPFMQKYADKIGADFITITEQKISHTTPHWEKFQLLDYLEKYDRILFIDTDVLIQKNCPNIFDLVPENEFGAFNEAPFVDRRDIAIENAAEAYAIKDFKWNGKYYNTGVMVVSKCHRFIFRKPEREVFNFYEQSYINLVLARQQVSIFNLPYQWNRMICMDAFTGKDRYESYIIHYAGVPFIDYAFGLIRRDIEVCQNLPNDYISKRHIWVNVQGGLGDQIQAEPVIRYMQEKLYPNEDIRISTHFPELFEHLPLICKKHGENLWPDVDSQPFTRVSLPGPETPQWRIISNLMCHTVDFISMAILTRTLPDIDKTIKLKLDPKSVENVKKFAKREDFKDCVLIHAGRHWQSKTFPKEWWQQLLYDLIDIGMTPILVGKDDETRGVVKLDLTPETIDLTNLLTLSEFIAAISLVPILISNDSSPIHIAGAFDNWIILIPTCKHPDHLLPYRNGTRQYKTSALYKKIGIDDMATCPTEVYGSLGDKMPGSWENYLPDVEHVTQEVKKILENLQ